MAAGIIQQKSRRRLVSSTEKDTTVPQAYYGKTLRRTTVPTTAKAPQNLRRSTEHTAGVLRDLLQAKVPQVPSTQLARPFGRGWAEVGCFNRTRPDDIL